MSEAPRRRLGEALKGLAASGLETVRTRLELLSVEVQEEKKRLAGFLFNSVLAALFVGFGALFLVAFFTVLWWDEHRLFALGFASLIFFGLGVAAAGNAARQLNSASRLFSASITELTKDQETLRRRD
ncbi:MAG: hypothetical protein HGA47_10190 [Zoogloea sp.]|nr:hypothetical protein [Zoogloea sp.]